MLAWGVRGLWRRLQFCWFQGRTAMPTEPWVLRSGKAVAGRLDLASVVWSPGPLLAVRNRYSSLASVTKEDAVESSAGVGSW